MRDQLLVARRPDICPRAVCDRGGVWHHDGKLPDHRGEPATIAMPVARAPCRCPRTCPIWPTPTSCCDCADVVVVPGRNSPAPTSCVATPPRSEEFAPCDCAPSSSLRVRPGNCGSCGRTANAAGSATIQARHAKLGTYVVDGTGFSLYLFEKVKGKKSARATARAPRSGSR